MGWRGSCILPRLLCQAASVDEAGAALCVAASGASAKSTRRALALPDSGARARPTPTPVTGVDRAKWLPGMPTAKIAVQRDVAEYQRANTSDGRASETARLSRLSACFGRLVTISREKPCSYVSKKWLSYGPGTGRRLWKSRRKGRITERDAPSCDQELKVRIHLPPAQSPQTTVPGGRLRDHRLA